jgi:DNA polymerase III, epsilon subunit and related 3''-5'' exonucleases
MTTYVLDTETTGIGKEDQVIELAYLTLLELTYIRETFEGYSPENRLHKDVNQLRESTKWAVQRFNPTVPINKHAYAVHKVSKLQLLKEPSSLRVEEYLPKGMSYMVGHSISFDYRMLKGKPEGVKLICTLALVKKLRKEHEVWKELDIENDKLNTYMSKLYPELTFSEAHNAKDDCIKVILLLCKVLPTMPEVESWEDLYNYINPKIEDK